MKKTKKLVSALLSAVLLTTLLFGCNTSGQEGGTGASGTPNASGTAAEALKPVNLEYYMVSSKPKDVELVLAELNKLAKRDLNATLNITFTTWTDYVQKYDMTLKSGGNVDFIYSASWMNYAQYASQGAFLELDDLIPKYAPKLQDMVDETVWNQLKIKGNIFAVPSNRFVYGSDGLAYRDDLVKSLGLPIPNSVENVEKYLLGVQKNDPKQGLFTPAAVQNPSGDVSSAIKLIMNLKYATVNQGGTSYGLMADFENPSELYDYWGSKDFIEDLKVVKRWADQGFWSRSILSDTLDPRMFATGKTVFQTGGMNPGKAAGARLEVAKTDPSWVSEFIPFAAVNGVAYYSPPTANMTSIPFNAKNPERALMLLEKIMTDSEYFNLIQYGIEGTHYKNVDGYYESIPGETGAEAYESGAFAWGFENPNLMLKSKNNEYFENLYVQLDKIREKTPFDGVNIYEGFIEDFDSYQAERAALGNVIAQYLTPLEVGLVNDVEAAVAEFLQKAESAGLKKIQEAYKAQWEAYCKEYGYVKK